MIFYVCLALGGASFLWLLGLEMWDEFVRRRFQKRLKTFQEYMRRAGAAQAAGGGPNAPEPAEPWAPYPKPMPGVWRRPAPILEREPKK